MTHMPDGPEVSQSLRVERMWHKANRPRKVTKGPYMGLYGQGPAGDRAVIRLDLDAQTGAPLHLGWDCEGGASETRNMLCSPASLQLISSDDFDDVILAPRKINRHGPDRVRSHYAQCAVEWTVGKPKGGVRVIYEPRSTSADGLLMAFEFARETGPMVILGGQPDDGGSVRPPFILHAPGRGPLLLKLSPRDDGYARLTSTRNGYRLALYALPSAPGKPVEFTMQPIQLDVPTDVAELVWPALRRCWLDALRTTHGAPDVETDEPPSGLFVAPDAEEPCAAWLPLWADMLLNTPELTKGRLNLMESVRRTVDYLLDRRFPLSTADLRARLIRSAEQLEKLGNSSVWVSAHLDGVIPAYSDHIERLDGNTGVLIGAWAVWRQERDTEWLKAHWKTLDRLGQYLERCDADGDGLVETPDLLSPPDTSAVCDAAINALVCRAWLCLADMAKALKKRDRCDYWLQRVGHLRQACRGAFRHPASGEWARWRGADGAPCGEPVAWVAGLAVNCGMIRPAEARAQLERWWREDGSIDDQDSAVPSDCDPEHLYAISVCSASRQAGLHAAVDRALARWLQARWSADPSPPFQAPLIYTVLQPVLPDSLD